MEQNLKILKDFASSFTPGKSDNFIFLGATGLGKTHLSSSVAQAVIANGYYVVYESALTMFSDYEEKKFKRSSYYDADYEFDKYVECDLLLIDDLGLRNDELIHRLMPVQRHKHEAHPAQVHDNQHKS